MTRTEQIASHVIFFLIWTLVLVNVGFIFNITISEHTLPVSYFLYLLGVLIWKLKHKQGTTLISAASAVLIPLFFIVVGTQLFAKTFDSSYDGQAYHQSAVINLANNWNPLKDSDLPIAIPEATPYVIGYPKSLWILQTSIYKLFPAHINIATVTNLLITLLASVFVYGFLRRLKLSKSWSAVVTILAVMQPSMIQQFFTFMADGFSYEVMLIAISSLGMVMMDQEKKFPLSVFFFSLILLAGTKFSNLVVLGILGLVGGIYLLKIILNSVEFNKIMVVYFFASTIILFVPFWTNIIRYNSPIYPSNTQWAKDDLQHQNRPQNLRWANKLELLFYGVYSKAQVPSSAESPQNIARLKIPFTTTLQEINNHEQFSGRVGSEGVLFSGLITVSFLLLASLFALKKTFRERKIMLIIFISVVIIISTLAMPVPNKLRYSTQFYLIPICGLLAIVLLSQEKKRLMLSAASGIFVILIGLNSLLIFIPTMRGRINEVRVAQNEMVAMRDSHIKYQIQAKSFYSSYIRLKEYGVNFFETEKISCRNPHALRLSSYTTFYCP